MATYTEIPQSYRLRQTMTFWSNLVSNLHESCLDGDLFAPANGKISRERVARFIGLVSTQAELDQMENGRASHRCFYDDSIESMLKKVWNTPAMRDRCRAVVRAIAREVKDGLPATDEQDMFKARVDELQRTLKLSDLERDLMLFAYLMNTHSLAWPRRIPDEERPMYIARGLNRSYGEIAALLKADGRLRRFQLVSPAGDCTRRLGEYLGGSGDEPLGFRFFRLCDVSDALPWRDYGVLSETHGKVVKDMIAANVAAIDRPRGLNILLYGAPGTGKTSFAKTLAKELGLTLYEIRQGDSDVKCTPTDMRLTGIQLCNEQVDATSSLMLVDEADALLRSEEDFFIFPPAHTTEKGVMNAILDETRVTTIWIANTAAADIDPSVRRRFDYSIRYEALTDSQRETIWRNAVVRLNLGALIPEARIPGLARRYPVSAGGISIVLENVKEIGPAPSEVATLIDTLMHQHCELMGVRTGDDQFRPAKDYSLTGLNIKGKIPLERIIASAKRYMKEAESADTVSPDRPRMNVLLWGPPGSGKTEFVKHLGDQLGRPVLVKKGSDILNCYVGGTEGRIRAAFREAEQMHAILFFDEIDGLLQTRERASKSWEVSQVSELLQQMESFNGIMVAATNFFRNLDPAIMRRFTFKLEFDYLTDAGKRHFFEQLFKTTLTTAEAIELDAIPNLCPGDFRTVRQSLYYLGDDATNEDRLAALRTESDIKGTTCPHRPIGF